MNRGVDRMLKIMNIWKSRRSVALLMAAVMAASVLTGCSSEKSGGAGVTAAETAAVSVDEAAAEMSEISASSDTDTASADYNDGKEADTDSNVTNGLPVVSDGNYPESFDLRDYGYVTPVKLQNPFGYCWAFAACAAAETSILSSLGKTYEETGLDLSEHHLAWFAKSHIPAEGEDGYDSSNSQSGEGYYTQSWAEPGDYEGGYPLYAIPAFAAGIGAASEETAPYMGKNGEKQYISAFGIFGKQAYCYSADDDWSLDEDIRYSRMYDLEAAYLLPEMAADGDSLNEEGIEAAKQMLVTGHGIAVAFTTDDENDEDAPKYMNEKTYAHYAYEKTYANHCVCIVGWDDSYSRENFNSDNPLPAGDGAWIAKNSWGAKDEEFPNKADWGIDGTGYFYISYYDMSLELPSAFDFDTTADSSQYDVVGQYDFLMTADNTYHEDENKVVTANVFEAEEDMSLEAVGTMCSFPGVSITYEVYILDDDFTGPTDGTAAASFERDYTYAGYYREKLDSPIELKKGQKYSVTVCQKDSEKYYYQYAESLTGADSILSLFSSDYYVAIMNEGESFISFEGKGWQDMRDYLEIEGDGTDAAAFDNFSIKAFGRSK